MDNSHVTNIEIMGRQEHMDALNAELEKLTKGNVELMNAMKPLVEEVCELRGEVEKLSKWYTVDGYESLRSEDSWCMEMVQDRDFGPLEAKLREYWGGSQTEDGQDGNDENEDQGENGNSPGGDDYGDDGRCGSEWGADSSEEAEPDDNERDDKVSEYQAGKEGYEEEMEYADEWYPSTFLRRLNMLSPHQVTLPKFEEIEDFEAWDKAIRELCKFLGILDTLDGSPSWSKTDEEHNEEHDWLEFMISQSLSNQFKKMLDSQHPCPSAWEIYGVLKDNLADKRRARRDQLVAQMDRLSHATSGNNASGYLEQFLMIREKLLGLGDEGKVTESAIFGRFCNGLRGPAVKVIGRYQMVSWGEQLSVQSFAAYAGHLLNTPCLPQNCYY